MSYTVLNSRHWIYIICLMQCQPESAALSPCMWRKLVHHYTTIQSVCHREIFTINGRWSEEFVSCWQLCPVPTWDEMTAANLYLSLNRIFVVQIIQILVCMAQTSISNEASYCIQINFFWNVYANWILSDFLLSLTLEGNWEGVIYGPQWTGNIITANKYCYLLRCTQCMAPSRHVWQIANLSLNNKHLAIKTSLRYIWDWWFWTFISQWSGGLLDDHMVEIRHTVFLWCSRWKNIMQRFLHSRNLH